MPSETSGSPGMRLLDELRPEHDQGDCLLMQAAFDLASKYRDDMESIAAALELGKEPDYEFDKGDLLLVEALELPGGSAEATPGKKVP